MGININESADGKSVTIRIDGRFDFSLHKNFREAYKDKKGAMDFTVDLSKAEYLDSSALGMLLLLKKHTDTEGGKVVITSPQPDVKKVLTIANFDKIFTIT